MLSKQNAKINMLYTFYFYHNPTHKLHLFSNGYVTLQEIIQPFRLIIADAYVIFFHHEMCMIGQMSVYKNESMIQSGIKKIYIYKKQTTKKQLSKKKTLIIIM